MKHIQKFDMMADAALVTKEAGEEDPDDIVTKAIGDLTKTIDQRLNDIEQKTDTSKLVSRLDKLEAKQNRASGDDDDPNEAAELEKKAFAVYLRKGNQATDEELKSLTTSNDEQGGYIAPAEMSTEFIRDLVEFSPIRTVASVRSITAGSVKYPKRTGITNAQWEDEAEGSEESTATFGQVEVPARKLMTYVDISNELLSDSGGTAEAEVRLALAEDFGKKEGTGFVNGTGAGQPEGIMVNPDVGEFLNGHATNLSADQMIKMMYSLPAAYRNAGTWMMNGTTLGILRTLKDGDGRLLWQPSFQAGQPETILGRPVIEAVDMPDLAAGAFPIVYGDFSGYRIVDRLAMSILANPYLLATKGLTRMHATRRVGGRVIQAARFKKLKMATS